MIPCLRMHISIDFRISAILGWTVWVTFWCYDDFRWGSQWIPSSTRQRHAGKKQPKTFICRWLESWEHLKIRIHFAKFEPSFISPGDIYSCWWQPDLGGTASNAAETATWKETAMGKLWVTMESYGKLWESYGKLWENHGFVSFHKEWTNLKA